MKESQRKIKGKGHKGSGTAYTGKGQGCHNGYSKGKGEGKKGYR